MFKRWYDRIAIENFRGFITVYEFGFTPKISVNISASRNSPLNKIVKETHPDIEIRNTYRGRVDIKNMPTKGNYILSILINCNILE